jgi:hypothetical protein
LAWEHNLDQPSKKSLRYTREIKQIECFCGYKTIINEVQALWHKVFFLSSIKRGIATCMTALTSLPAYLDLAKVIGLGKSIQKHLKVRDGGLGWTDSQMVLSFVLLIKSCWWRLCKRISNIEFA